MVYVADRTGDYYRIRSCKPRLANDCQKDMGVAYKKGVAYKS